MAWSLIDQLERAEGLLTVQQLAKIYGVSRQSIYEAHSRGTIPSANIGIDVLRFDPYTLVQQLRRDNPDLRVQARELKKAS